MGNPWHNTKGKFTHRPIVLEGKKECAGCKKIKSFSEYHKNEKAWDKYKSYCKDCRNEWRRTYTKTASYIYNKLQERSKLKHMPICSKEEFKKWYNLQEKICVYCSIPQKFIPLLNHKHRNGYVNKIRLEIDRADNDKGYLLTNLLLACPMCNETKGRLIDSPRMFRIGKILTEIWKEQIKGGDFNDCRTQ